MRTFAKVRRWEDWASFALGLGLALSPWIVGYSHHDAATANEVLIGLSLAVVAHVEVLLEIAAAWVNLAAGIWLVAAPFALDLADAPGATIANIALGSTIALLALSAVSVDKGMPYRWHMRKRPLIR